MSVPPSSPSSPSTPPASSIASKLPHSIEVVRIYECLGSRHRGASGDAERRGKRGVPISSLLFTEHLVSRERDSVLLSLGRCRMNFIFIFLEVRKVWMFANFLANPPNVRMITRYSTWLVDALSSPPSLTPLHRSGLARILPGLLSCHPPRSQMPISRCHNTHPKANVHFD